MRATWAVRRRRLAGLLLLVPLGGCGSLGPGALGRDHLDYAQAITDAQKQQTLLNVVRLRYADVPVFLSVEQVISSYSLEGTGTVGVSPETLSGTVDYAERPTITFSPVTGAQLAESFVRPLAPSELFPLAENGLPIDVLLRLAVQSIGRIESAGSPEFLPLVADLRALQQAGALRFRFVNDKEGPHVYLAIASGADPALGAVAAEARSLLGIGTGEVEIVYGLAAPRRDRLPVLTRSILGVLAYVGRRIDVPDDDIAAHRTLPAVGAAAGEPRPAVVVQAARERPPSPFVAVQYGGRWFWIADTDFESKLAFSLVQLLMAIAEGEGKDSRAPVLTIPAG